MKFLGILGLISAVNSLYVPLLRSPAFDTAVVRSERFHGGFAYNSIENHGYVPAVSAPQVYYYFVTYPGHTFNFIPSVNPQYPNVIYTQPVNPTVGQNPFAPGGGGFPQYPNQPPIEVEDPADGSADEIKQGSNSPANNDDDDSVTIEALK